VPVIAIDAPPVITPALGKIVLGLGGARYVYGDPELVPDSVVTVTGTAPTASPGGTVTLIAEGLRTVKKRAGIAPNRMVIAPFKFVPCTVIVPPPDKGPEDGVKETIVGTGGAVYVYVGPEGLEPPGPETMTAASPPPDGPAGTVAVILVSDRTVKEARLAPKATEVAYVKPEPEILVLFPPAVGPVLGVIEVVWGTFNVV
jgi:hypothetical protein